MEERLLVRLMMKYDRSKSLEKEHWWNCFQEEKMIGYNLNLKSEKEKMVIKHLPFALRRKQTENMYDKHG